MKTITLTSALILTACTPIADGPTVKKFGPFDVVVTPQTFDNCKPHTVRQKNPFQTCKSDPTQPRSEPEPHEHDHDHDDDDDSIDE